MYTSRRIGKIWHVVCPNTTSTSFSHSLPPSGKPPEMEIWGAANFSTSLFKNEEACQLRLNIGISRRRVPGALISLTLQRKSNFEKSLSSVIYCTCRELSQVSRLTTSLRLPLSRHSYEDVRMPRFLFIFHLRRLSHQCGPIYWTLYRF